jgi:hypothetical protein
VDDQVAPDVIVACIGGHLRVPKEQNTQQSPGFGRRTVLQPSHSYKYWHASSGITSSFEWPQRGHVSTDWRSTEEQQFSGFMFAAMKSRNPSGNNASRRAG